MVLNLLWSCLYSCTLGCMCLLVHVSACAYVCMYAHSQPCRGQRWVLGAFLRRSTPCLFLRQAPSLNLFDLCRPVNSRTLLPLHPSTDTTGALLHLAFYMNLGEIRTWAPMFVCQAVYQLRLPCKG